MYLKSIEVQGFKSFANKIVFDFHNGITGIVGPNGSGKSNVGDAVRWVLGEQKVKQLRGGTMQDVIFSGTENRKPLSYAMVAITLDNSDHHLPIDYQEVTVARKLYRSGESEYLINGSACRLKDVNELFYDTGIGKEGYSIIGQGQIDKILSGKPEERRELFDEAAGIVKFKRRKMMSLRKLEDERQNLVRVNDILSELGRQVGPLEKQSETAREYLKKKEELKRYDINQFLIETTRVREQLGELESKSELAVTELEEAKGRYESTKVRYEELEEQIEEIDQSIEKSRSQMNESRLLKQQLEGQISLLREQINSARMSDEHYARRLKALQEEIETKNDQLSHFRNQRNALREELNSRSQSENGGQTELLEIQSQIAELNAKIEQGQNSIFEILNNRASTKAKIQHYETMLQQIQTRKSEIHKRMIEVKSADSEKEALHQKYESELREISGQIADDVNRSGELQRQISELQKEISEKERQLAIGQTAYHREHSRLESLKNMTERYDGYGNSIRRVMEQKSREQGIYGVVADLIKVDKEYETAIETALGGSIQNIVTEDEGTAKRLIQYLKQNKYGRATFLPLTAISGNQGFRSQEALREPGVIGLANALVHVEDQYKKLADHLLGKTIVVGHIDDGIVLARKYRQSLRIVTVEGELINPGGAMTGGAFKNSSSLLSRRREIEEFEKTVVQLKSEMDEQQQQVLKAKEERAYCYTQVEELKQRLQSAYVVQNTAKMNLNQVSGLRKSAQDTMAQILEDGKQIENQVQEIRENQDSIQVELEVSEKMEKDLALRIEEWQKEMEVCRQEETAAQKVAEEAHLSYAGLEQKDKFLSENILRLEEEIHKAKAELEELETGKKDTAGEIHGRETQISGLEATIADSASLFDEIQGEITLLSEQKEERSRDHKALLRQREELTEKISDLDKEIFRLTSRREGLEESAEKQINYMWDEYELTYNLAAEQRDEELTDLTFIRKQIQGLKNDIKGLGAVNVNAIEDYKEVSERYEFMKTQQEDLVEAEETLLGIVEELDAAMRSQFQQQFAVIQTEFDKVFKQLFGGGKGTLELMEEEDILEAGVRIIAQPPGKKLQNMMQLSGGEKALTAIALLFAIQNLKPSPFCLLDEIEAALDDNNVDRFAQYLHKLTKNTQFIVITHRRGTMNAADRLYGITMQEKGVSTLVSVDLIENELDK